MSSEPHITNNTSQITSRYYLYIIRIHSLVLRTFAPGIHSYKLNIETISQRNRRAGRQERGTKTSAWIDGGKKRLIASRFGRDVACNNDRRLRPNEPIRKRNQAMNQRRSASPDGPRTTCFIQYRSAVHASDVTDVNLSVDHAVIDKIRGIELRRTLARMRGSVFCRLLF